MVWEKTSERFVGFFDIMGFKDLVYRNNHTFVLEKMLRIEEDIVAKIKLVSEKDLMSENTQGGVIPAIFSDSLLLVTNGTTAGDAVKIIAASIYLLTKCFELKMPIKGALSYGTFTADFEKSIFLGQPLIDAHLLQDELYLYGCVLDNKIEKFMEENYPFYIDAKMIRYKTPLKSGRSTHININWMKTYSESTKNKESSKDAITKLYHSISGKPRIYIDNTIDFVEKHSLLSPLK